MRKSVYLDNTIEFLRSRVYLGAYDYTPQDTDDMVFFTVEDTIFYNSFHLDFGPMNIGHLYRFAVIFHEILNDPENAKKSVVFYSSTSTRQRANTACMLCCYMVLVQGWTPHQVLQPLAQVDPPFMPFRDAGYSNADFEITIQDVIYGVWRAKEKGLIDLQSFNLETYERYERVENGDFNVLTPDFIAFASPQESNRSIGVTSSPGKSHLNQPFRSVLKYFSKNNVQLVVRLNSHLYNKQHFEDLSIQHIDMIFEDGTCPDMSIVKNFVGAAETIINKGGKIAVHCKAGLGRTGCLIGAHLIYTHGFTANECIGFMRFIRPGMVVGPQQHWLYLHQNDFREWKYTMKLSLDSSEIIGDLYPLVSLEEYRIQKKRLREGKKIPSNFEHEDSEMRDLAMTPPSERRKSVQQMALTGSGFQTAAVPQTSPGQPRKGQNGSNTIEDINKQNSKSAGYTNEKNRDTQNSTSINDTNNSDEEMMQSDDIVLKQLLPRNRRIISGKRAVSAGVRKISGTTKK
ncbi:hypothetical protein Kpol_1008p28 [Vanderwaltozyma polyspora DSM 70294]|uniref:Tyrosine-protein phosphatase CDC14 n=1 Tax=Vanderwaltozyma polyspora (strain ATCC 22028 / DSM 70294 / BCRC 21397 / CBS 2163 / NBRC 10782 / NRRL Y-8283 / UCD 57-17) TaxID=436907 RepID=A7TPZ1_VANPO|nr:uncharacterized protein Kpol_1008p28 [Vanderwaltozyma polyspora DSM 70294]EDO15689.1 hypothetical protein Kpol_1008p28 [Vanderwaltozyma polyspora DSM 70294]